MKYILKRFQVVLYVFTFMSARILYSTRMYSLSLVLFRASEAVYQGDWENKMYIGYILALKGQSENCFVQLRRALLAVQKKFGTPAKDYLTIYIFGKFFYDATKYPFNFDLEIIDFWGLTQSEIPNQIAHQYRINLNFQSLVLFSFYAGRTLHDPSFIFKNENIVFEIDKIGECYSVNLERPGKENINKNFDSHWDCLREAYRLAGEYLPGFSKGIEVIVRDKLNIKMQKRLQIM